MILDETVKVADEEKFVFHILLMEGTMPPVPRICSNCQYYDLATNSCRRFPPIKSDAKTDRNNPNIHAHAVYPQVDANEDTCGEWKQK